MAPYLMDALLPRVRAGGQCWWGIGTTVDCWSEHVCGAQLGGACVVPVADCPSEPLAVGLLATIGTDCLCAAAAAAVAAGVSSMLTAYHPCRVPLAWAAQQLGFDTDQLDEVRVSWVVAYCGVQVLGWVSVCCVSPSSDAAQVLGRCCVRGVAWAVGQCRVCAAMLVAGQCCVCALMLGEC
jgi:hypothetical protein